MCGSTESYGNGLSDFYLIKTDGSGNEQWSQTYGGTSDDYASYVQQTTDGGYIICGKTFSFANADNVYLIKTDASGSEQWSNTYGISGGGDKLCVQQTLDGGYIIVGTTNLVLGMLSDIFLLKVSATGSQQWIQSHGEFSATVPYSVRYNYAYSVRQTLDEGYIIGGTTGESYNGERYMILIKTDENGNQQSIRTFGAQRNFCET